MGKETGKTSPKSGGRGRRTKARLHRNGSSLPAIRAVLLSPLFAWALVVTLVFVLVCGWLVIWAREQPLVAVGRVMDETRTVRVAFTTPDDQATEDERERERQRTPRVYVAELAVLDEIRASLENLPRTLSAVESLDDVEKGIRERFRLTADGLTAIQNEAIDGEPKQSWISSVKRLDILLKRRPLLDDQTWQRAMQDGTHDRIELRVGEEMAFVPRGVVLNAESDTLPGAMRELARDAGFHGPALEVVVNRLAVGVTATFRYDGAATADRQEAAARLVKPIVHEYGEGHVIFTRGQVLTHSNHDLLEQEMRRYRAMASPWQLWLARLGVLGAIAVIAAAGAVYVGLFNPRIRRNPTRMWALAGLMGGALAIATAIATAYPGLATISAVIPALFVAVILVIAYEQRMALALSALYGVLVCIALNQPIGTYAIIILGAGVSVWQLREIRDRTSLIRMSIVTCITLAIGVVLVGLFQRPIVPQSIREIFTDAMLTGFGAVLVGAITLFILPVVERLFDISTGMSLIELRDPKQPLLRELQLRAPGTYNHSLSVANIAEAAADAIGADSLLTYVGALYHDVGKMNKPDYFVENQTPGFNRHDKLSPAMSLLVIVGHVKDGMEIAHQFDLPRTLHHFIEAHHGTTLVEFFFTRAKEQAEDPDDAMTPDEVEYRYPGPKPRTKEAAILMLADSVESATRTLTEPTPSRIEALVEAIANKRLLDGQFDECELTLRELHTIVGSISKTLASIYHGRIAYPSSEKRA